jgi:hypothetical protein
MAETKLVAAIMSRRTIGRSGTGLILSPNTLLLGRLTSVVIQRRVSATSRAARNYRSII